MTCRIGAQQEKPQPLVGGFSPPAFPLSPRPVAEMSQEFPLSHRLQVLVGSASNLLHSFMEVQCSSGDTANWGPHFPLRPPRAAVTVSGWVPAGASTITQHLTGSVSLCFDPLERTRNKD